MIRFQALRLSLIWTRSIVLFVSISIVAISLAIYNKQTTPALSLLQEIIADSDAIQGRENQIIHDMIQNKRLIATLIAAQISIFCPLFFLLNMTMLTFSDVWCTFIELFCQALMPLGLGITWIISISFNEKIRVGKYIGRFDGVHDIDEGYDGLVKQLKIVIVSVLAIEIAVLSMFSFACSYNAWKMYRTGGIHLLDEDEFDASTLVLPYDINEEM
ncbi:MAG: hypothetical protein EXX96DRAFT_473184 [Benjaminiella poitrasii]|nr:MAG: hypothetical protein EXX96DRAFT_473184 [Benjaminiella poitrasii]